MNSEQAARFIPDRHGAPPVRPKPFISGAGTAWAGFERGND